MKLLLLSVFVGRALCFSNAQLASSKPPVGCVRPWVSFERGVLFAGLKRFKMIDAARNSIQCHESVSSERDPMQRFDSTAVIKYSIALITQVSLFTVSFCSLDKVVSAIGVIKVPWILNFFFFYAIALKSRVLNPLANNRPKVQSLEVEAEPQRKRVLPTWTPPGPVFPIMWLLIIGPLRAASSTLVYQATRSYANPAIVALIFHLSLGDIWNTINNVEKRFGVAVVGVLAVWLSKAYAVYRFSQVDLLAGKMLSLTMVWLSIAAALVTATWKLNPDPATGKPEPLYPVQGEIVTKFAWGSRK